MLKKFLLFLLVLLIAVVGGSYFYLMQTANYQTDGEIVLTGLRGKVRIVRDAKGMPYIYAENRHDLLMAQGFAMAQDRLFQMQLTRMFAEGRIAELAGKIATDLDRKHRLIGFKRAAEKHVQLLDEAERADLEAFVGGVNQFIAQGKDLHLEFSLAQLTPEPWTLATPVSIVYYMGWSSSANMEAEVLLHQLKEKLGEEAFKTILPLHSNPDAPQGISNDSISVAAMLKTTAETRLFSEKWLANAHRGLQWGSNNWATDGTRSTSGMPILAGDPHLDSRIMPGTMYACGLFSPDIRAVGTTIPGMPGLLIGRNEYLTNSLTNAYLDVQDLYVLQLDPKNEGNYLMGDTSLPFQEIEETLKIKSAAEFKEETLKIRLTKYGVVVNDLFPEVADGQALVLRWAALENMKPKLGLSHLLDATSVAEANAILENATMGCNNIVIADKQGDIFWRTIGSLPKRKKGTGRMPYAITQADTIDNWLGMVSPDSMPQLKNPERGWVGNANNNMIPEAYPHYVSNFFSPHFRYTRLKILMDSQEKFSAEDHWEFQRDCYNTLAEKLTPLIVNALQQDEATAPVANRLAQWDFMETLESVETTLFQYTYRYFAQAVFEDELGEALSLAYLKNWYVWQERLEQMYLAGNSPWFDDVRTPDIQESLDDLLVKAAKRATDSLSVKYGENMEDWQWGKTHQIYFVHPLFREGGVKEWFGEQYPMAGSGETLYRARYAFDNPNDVSFSACLRMVVDLADDEKVLAVLAGGTTGRTFHKHQHSQLDAYMSGEPVYWWFNDEQIEIHKISELTLTP